MCGNMISSYKMTPWLMAILCLVTAGSLNITDQQTSESHQHEQVAILKQIRKVNDDGSYTFGYEAGDGSFKVETRDVLGNVKGTFGFVDGNGEIKRVSYSSSNGTGFKSTTLSPLQEQRGSVVQSIPRVNRSSSSTRRPSTLAYSTSTESSSSTASTPKLNVIQSIPRSRVKTTTSTTTTTTSSSSTTGSNERDIQQQQQQHHKTVYGHYVKSKNNRPKIYINSQQRGLSEEESIDIIDEDSQISRPNSGVEVKSKHFFIKRPIDHNLRPITDEFEDKDDELKSGTSGNSLRRQLQEETTIKVEESSENNDENSDVYSGSLSTARPLFTTSSTPRIIQRRPIYSNQNHHNSHHHHHHHYQQQSVNQDNMMDSRYEDVKSEEREAVGSAGEPYVRGVASSRMPQRVGYVKQNVEPIYLRQPPTEQLFRDLSTGILNNEEDPNGEISNPPPVQPPIPVATSPLNHYHSAAHSNNLRYRNLPIDRLLSRLQQVRQPIYNQMSDDNIDYLMETNSMDSQMNSNPTPRMETLTNNYRSRQYPRYIEYIRARNNLKQMNQIDDDYDNYQRNLILPPEPPNPIAPPLSRRDFQLLLRRLLVSQYGIQALNHPRSYLDDAFYDQQSYSSYQTSSYQSPVSQRPPLPLPPQSSPSAPSMPSSPVNIDPNLPIYTNPHYQDVNYYDPRIINKRVYRQKYYNDPDVINPDADRSGDEILPPPIREALLLRMLQLAIQTGNNQRNNLINPNVNYPPINSYKKIGPVRSVQILSNDKTDDNKDLRKKM